MFVREVLHRFAAVKSRDYEGYPLNPLIDFVFFTVN